MLAALALGLLLPEMDRRTSIGESDLIFGGGADAARTVLDAIASSMITVTSLTFSLTVVTLQLASSQFSPRLLRTSSSGFLIDVDGPELVSVVCDRGAVVFIERDPGDSVVAGTPIGWVWRADGGRWTDEERDELIDQVCSRMSTGFERTGTSDIALGLRQLTDVAVKALSPGINDPTTAVHALGHSSALLCELSLVPLGPRLLRDGDDAVRLVLSRPVFADLVAIAVEQPAHYGRADSVVMSRLFALLREVAWTKGSHTVEPVEAQLARLRRLVAGADLDPIDRTRLELDADRVDEALAGRWDQTGRRY